MSWNPDYIPSIAEADAIIHARTHGIPDPGWS